MAAGETSDRANSSAQDGLEREERQSVQGYIAIKGTRNGLLLTLEPETPFSELLNALANRLAEAPGFFRGASLAIDTSRRRLRVSESIQLENLLAQYQMSVTSLEAIASAGQGSEAYPSPAPADSLSIITYPLSEHMPMQQDLRQADGTLFLRRTIRSGQAIQHIGNIVVLGDINPGAEVVASGDVIVWGVLRGMVHAGYPDHEKALVCALLLAPVQLRIAHLLSRPPEGGKAVQLGPEIAIIKNGRIVVENWGHGRPSRK